MSWIDYRPQEYLMSLPRWTYAADHYSGEVLDPSKVQGYLIRKAQGETEDAFKERCQLADYTNHFATVADSLVGMLAAVESDASRVFSTDTSKGLGDPTDRNTPIGRLWINVDGRGTGYLTFWKLLGLELVVAHKAWVVVDTGVRGNPLLRLFPAASVVNWWYDENGVLASVLVEEVADKRASIRDQPEQGKQYTLFELGGWSRYTRDAQTGEAVATGEEGTYRYEDRDGNPALPIFPVELPLNRPVGWLLAKKANAIFNKESERDHLLRHANFPRLILSANDDLYGKLIEGLAKGSNVLQEDPEAAGGGHRFAAPDPGSADIATKILERKVDEFYVTAFREYGDAARERTATEVRQDVSSGVGAFLQMLKAALDDAENSALWRIEQTVRADDRSFTCRVERSDDFVTNDINLVIERLRERYFGKEGVVPIGREGRIRAAQQIAEWDGFEVDEEDIRSAIDTDLLMKSLDAASMLPLPAEALAQMAVRYLIQSGQIDAEQLVEMENGERYRLADLVLQQARTLAEARETAELRTAESFPEEETDE